MPTQQQCPHDHGQHDHGQHDQCTLGGQAEAGQRSVAGTGQECRRDCGHACRPACAERQHTAPEETTQQVGQTETRPMCRPEMAIRWLVPVAAKTSRSWRLMPLRSPTASARMMAAAPGDSTLFPSRWERPWRRAVQRPRSGLEQLPLPLHVTAINARPARTASRCSRSFPGCGNRPLS